MNSIFGTSLSRALIVSALLALFAVPCVAQTQSPGKPGTTTTVPHMNKTLRETIINSRIAQGYAVIGPLELKGASSSELVLATPLKKDPVTVNLKDRKVSVMDEAGNGLTMSAVKAGSNVIICQKKDAVIIYVVPSTKKESGNAK